MTDEERRLITEFIGRVVEAGGEEIDPEAEALLGELFDRHPEARYRVTQMAFFQEHALAEANNRIQQLEWQLERAQQSRSMFGGLFGGGGQTLPPPASHAPGYRPGLFDQAPGRPSFIGGAASTALGVMGGFLLAGAVTSMLSGDAQADVQADALAGEENEGLEGNDLDDDLEF